MMALVSSLTLAAKVLGDPARPLWPFASELISDGDQWSPIVSDSTVKRCWQFRIGCLQHCEVVGRPSSGLPRERLEVADSIFPKRLDYLRGCLPLQLDVD